MRNMAFAMRVKFDKYWGDCNLLMSVAAVLDPRWKMKFIHFTFSKMYTPLELDSKIKQVEDVMLQIYNTYASDIASSSSAIGNVSSELQTDSVNSQSYDCMLAFTDYVLSSGSIQPSKSDLQVYLEEGLFLANTEHFDILDWWKLNTLKYPCLSKMARDILSIPITTVASESAFSTGGRVLNDYRSSLSSKTVNALICSSSWIRSSTTHSKTPMVTLSIISLYGICFFSS
ncbi:zinc finger BED domain-containing protein RICESLEEPER 1-like [Phalaenopsis equestris]|uniref:zinc finger BED domain-containing protein RICESLEEPER 1-like n=1 Tax=Phalaenopsis equestris TaxID=78828 RepID=UPI0009E2D66C|nr:zinc finger BED domain-containing protein RICESLEEPER 1-like [Phalaenopsis equestris]